jgi:cysteine desulfurase
MSVTRAYLDHNATAPIRPEAAAAIVAALALPGNPSSIHADGRAARAVVETAREQVAALVGAQPRWVYFTSGGTEAAATVLTPGLRRAKRTPDLLLLCATEHACVREGHRFAQQQVEHVPVDANGVVDLGWLGDRLARHDGIAMVSVHAANNETGVLQPVAEIAALTKAHDAIFHSDAVQAAGRIPLGAGAPHADVLTLSAHKFGGPKGVGAIVMRDTMLALDDRLIRGGGQERSLRAGTENVAAIAGFGAAAEIANRNIAAESARMLALRDEFEARLVEIAPEVTIFGSAVQRLPNTSAFAIPGLTAERALILFDLAHVSVSSGSACSSGKVRRSHVLAAMGFEDAIAECAMRVSFGWSSSMTDVEMGVGAVRKAVVAAKNRIQAAA